MSDSLLFIHISQIVKSEQILAMFRILDNQNKGYFDISKFIHAYKVLRLQRNTSKHENDENIKHTFSHLAIRRLKHNRDRVYF